MVCELVLNDELSTVLLYIVLSLSTVLHQSIKYLTSHKCTTDPSPTHQTASSIVAATRAGGVVTLRHTPTVSERIRACVFLCAVYLRARRSVVLLTRSCIAAKGCDCCVRRQVTRHNTATFELNGWHHNPKEHRNSDNIFHALGAWGKRCTRFTVFSCRGPPCY
jgi:hypothetical protein